MVLHSSVPFVLPGAIETDIVTSFLLKNTMVVHTWVACLLPGAIETCIAMPVSQKTHGFSHLDCLIAARRNKICIFAENTMVFSQVDCEFAARRNKK